MCSDPVSALRPYRRPSGKNLPMANAFGLDRFFGDSFRLRMTGELDSSPRGYGAGAASLGMGIAPSLPSLRGYGAQGADKRGRKKFQEGGSETAPLQNALVDECISFTLTLPSLRSGWQKPSLHNMGQHPRMNSGASQRCRLDAR